MNEKWAILYGILQGITEFLPVSSSGHLALIPFFTKIEDPGVFFDLMMHLGTALAVILYFREDCLRLLKEVFNLIKTRKVSQANAYGSNFLISTLASVIVILLIKDAALVFGRGPLIIALNLLFFGILLFVCDFIGRSSKNLVKTFDLKTALIIGIAQAFAIFPGVSRSGITLSAGRLLGLSRIHAGRFSFLLSLPIIFASILYKVKSILSGEEVLRFDIYPAVIGVVVSFIIGILTIHFFLKLLNHLGFWVYALYRAILATIIISMVTF